MSKEIDFELGTVVPSEWLDAMQEVMSGAVVNMRLEKQSSNAFRVINVDTTENMGIVIDGKIRYANAGKSVTVAGAAATYSVYAAAVAAPSRDFTVGFWNKALTADPVGITVYREIGRFIWDGSQISGEIESFLPGFSSGHYFHDMSTGAAAPTEAGDTIVNAQWVRDYIDSLQLGGIGDIKLFAGLEANVPSKWKLCVGQIEAQSAYPELFAMFGHAFNGGTAPSAGNFKFPDFRGRSPMAPDSMGGTDAARINSLGSQGNTLGGVGGLDEAYISLDHLPQHTHAGTVSPAGSHSHTTRSGSNLTRASGGGHGHSGTTSWHGGHGHGMPYNLMGRDSGPQPPAPPWYSYQAGGVSLYNRIVSGTNSGGEHDHTWSTGGGEHDHGVDIDAGGSHDHPFTGGLIVGYGALTKFSKMHPVQLVNVIIRALP